LNRRTTEVSTDVIVIGGGNAALCAALEARAHGVRVLLVERAPAFYRGGNSRHTRDFRLMHSKPNQYMTGVYSEDEFMEDLVRVTGNDFDHSLAQLVIRQSADLPDWLSKCGVKWQPPLRGTLHLSRTNMFLLGGGRAMMNAYYRSASRNGINIWYDSPVTDLLIEGNKFKAAIVLQEGRETIVNARAAVIACGGFEANLEWLRRYWGSAVDNFIVRGTPYNDGHVLSKLIEYGAVSVGTEKGFHAVAVDGRAPKFDGGIVTRLDSVPLGVVVNKHGLRFYDEGEDFWPKRYAIWGGLIAHQPGQIAYSIFDAKAMGKFMPSMFPPITSPTIRGLASQLDIDAENLERTVANYNESVRLGTFDPNTLDDCHTEGLDPPKSHWAIRIDTPPFYAYPLRTGITFTYLGVGIDEAARIKMNDGSVSPNMFGAGEIVAGNILKQGYLAGFGLTMGAVIGRIAGKGAAYAAQ
jgi:tricarballylate dehydrogenase